MIKILVPSASYILTDHLHSSEGISCYNLFKNLKKFNYHFEAISAQVRIKKPLKNVNFHQVGNFEFSPTLNPVKKYLCHMEFLALSYRKAKNILKRQKIDIIHHMLPAVYNQTFNLLAIFGKPKQPFILGPISSHFYPRPIDEKVLLKITAKLHMKTISKCERLITITNQIKTLYTKFFDEEKISTIPLGVDTSTFKPPSNMPEKNHQEILFVGYLYKIKGTQYLIKAMHAITKEHKDVKLRIIGNGPDKQQLIKLAEALKIKEKIEFEGFVPHNKMPKYYQQCDIFCFPTLGEPFGKSIIEAMACGKPVIASNIGGPAEIIKNGETGILVPPAQPKILAEKILKLLKDKKTAKKMGEKGRKTIMQDFSWEKIAEKYHKLYNSLN